MLHRNLLLPDMGLPCKKHSEDRLHDNQSNESNLDSSVHVKNDTISERADSAAPEHSQPQLDHSIEEISEDEVQEATRHAISSHSVESPEHQN